MKNYEKYEDEIKGFRKGVIFATNLFCLKSASKAIALK